jgi:hypothetical protein
LKKRRDLEEWAIDTPQLREELEKYLELMSKASEDTRLMEMILMIAPVKTKPVVGSNTDDF